MGSPDGTLRAKLATALRWTWDDLHHSPLPLVLGFAVWVGVYLMLDGPLPVDGEDGRFGRVASACFLMLPVTVMTRWPGRTVSRSHCVDPNQVRAARRLVAAGNPVRDPDLAECALDLARSITQASRVNVVNVPLLLVVLILLALLTRDDPTPDVDFVAAGVVAVVALVYPWIDRRVRQKALVTEQSALDLLRRAAAEDRA